VEAKTLDHPNPLPRGTRVAFVAAFVAALVVLRALELRTVAHLLYSPELFGLGSLAWDLDAGTFKSDASLWELVSTYQYMPFAQGTLLVQAAAALLGVAFGPNTWAFHSIGIAFEALTIALVATITVRAAGPVLGAAVLLPWLLPPAFVVAWQLMPYGNHTEFLWVPAALAVALSTDLEQRGRRWWVGIGVLVAVGIVLYRPSGAAAVAFVGAAALGSSRGVRRRLCVAVTAGIATAGVTISVLSSRWSAEPVGGDAGSSFLPRLDPTRADPARIEEAWGGAAAFFAAPRVLGGSLPYIGVLAVIAAWTAFVMVAGSGPRRRVATFALGWCVLALAAPLLFAPPHPEYLLAGFYAVLLGTVGVVGNGAPRWASRGAGLCCLLLAVAGAVDAASLVRPSSWEQTREYDGFGYTYELALYNLDVDEIPYLSSLVRDRVGDPWIGFSSKTGPEGCLAQPLRHGTGPLPDPGEAICPGWGPGRLAAPIQALMESASITSGDLQTLGRGAWIVCDRDLRRTEEALEGLSRVTRGHVLGGAVLESKRWASRASDTHGSR
jgi:hypothetical protein